LRVDADIFPLDQVAEAYEKMERGELRGRAVVIPD
jgi:D-arabinose 1-dehydrogenase-like Zn-dependent alcohol dehydrogenase